VEDTPLDLLVHLAMSAMRDLPFRLERIVPRNLLGHTVPGPKREMSKELPRLGISINMATLAALVRATKGSHSVPVDKSLPPDPLFPASQRKRSAGAKKKRGFAKRMQREKKPNEHANGEFKKKRPGLKPKRSVGGKKRPLVQESKNASG
jgi:hypothetical protein